MSYTVPLSWRWHITFVLSIVVVILSFMVCHRDGSRVSLGDEVWRALELKCGVP